MEEERGLIQLKLRYFSAVPTLRPNPRLPAADGEPQTFQREIQTPGASYVLWRSRNKFRTPRSSPSLKASCLNQDVRDSNLACLEQTHQELGVYGLVVQTPERLLTSWSMLYVFPVISTPKPHFLFWICFLRSKTCKTSSAGQQFIQISSFSTETTMVNRSH